MRTNTLLVPLVVASLAAACTDAPTAPKPLEPFIAGESDAGGKQLTVMSRNIYLGADLNPVIGAPAPQLIPIRVATVWSEVQQTNFPERAEALAAEIATENPDLVGLQEVAMWRTQFPGDAHLPNGVAANDTVYDFLKLLLNALEARGRKYEVASQAQGIDVELFMFTGTPGASLTRDIRMTLRDVVLARHNVKTFNAAGAQYNTKITIPVGGAGGPSLTIPRAWASVDVKFKGEMLRFFSTHLEVDSPPFGAVQVGQGNEVIGLLNASPYPVVAVGDYNSPAGQNVTATYANLIGSGLADVWALVNPLDPGFSAGLSHDLLGPVTDLATRIDLVLFRGNIDPVSAHLVGNTEADRTISGLMPSDHAGLVATVRIGN
jgi:endonuclease/exonuclease/phosphatase family metal-dependent hydrolase